MGSRKTLEKALAGSRKLRFDEVARLAEAFGFRLSRTRGRRGQLTANGFRSIPGRVAQPLSFAAPRPLPLNRGSANHGAAPSSLGSQTYRGAQRAPVSGRGA